MENLSKHPFLLSLKEAVEQTGDWQDYETMLHERQSAFKEYLYDSCHAEKSAEIRYEFLKTADYEVCRIRLMCADKIRAKNADFYHQWAKLIVDTRRYIFIGLKTLDFLATCPSHMLSEPLHTFPENKWTAAKNDLTEALVGIFETDVIRLKDGRRMSFALFAQFVGNFFGIEYNHPYVEMQKVFNRKKNQTPFLERLIASIKGKSAKRDELKK